jgi:hypothetical protein
MEREWYHKGRKVECCREPTTDLVDPRSFRNPHLLCHPCTAPSTQDLLGRQLTFKREVDAFKDRLAQSERDLVKVTTAARLHKGDKVRTVDDLC